MARTKEVAEETVVTVNEAVYPLKELVEAAESLGASKDIVSAAFSVSVITEATWTEALKIVKDFKERKVC